MQVILGSMAEIIAEEMKKLREEPSFSAPVSRAPASEPNRKTTIAAIEPEILAPVTGNSQLAPRYLAVGGRDNIKKLEASGTRLCVVLVNRDLISEPQLIGLGAKGIARPSANVVQIFLGQPAEAIAEAIKQMIQ